MPTTTQQPTTTRGTYRRHFIREKAAPPPLQLQDRDVEIIATVFENRFLTVPMLAVLFPPNEADRTRRYKGYPVAVTDQTHSNLYRRLRKLFHNGYLTRFHLDIGGEHIYALDKKGADLLRERQLPLPLSIDWTEKNRDLKHPYVEHTLMVARFHVALELAARAHPAISLTHFERESLDLKADWKRDNKRIYVNPDAFLILQDATKPHAPEYLNFFLEADRSTMQLKRIWEKCERYMKMFQDNVHRQAFDIADFRVLFTTRSQERASNIASIMVQDDSPILPAYRTLFYFTTEENYHAHPQNVLASIWKRADDLSPMRALVYSPLKRVS